MRENFEKAAVTKGGDQGHLTSALNEIHEARLAGAQTSNERKGDSATSGMLDFSKGLPAEFNSPSDRQLSQSSSGTNAGSDFQIAAQNGDTGGGASVFQRMHSLGAGRVSESPADPSLGGTANTLPDNEIRQHRRPGAPRPSDLTS